MGVLFHTDKKDQQLWLFSCPHDTQDIFYGILFMLPALFLFDFRIGTARFADGRNLCNLLYLGLGASALCFVTWNFAVKALGAVKTSVYIYMVPVITVVDFSDLAQGCKTYEEFIEKMKDVSESALQYLGIAICGAKKKVNKLTGSMALLR